MTLSADTFLTLWDRLIWPLLRLIASISVGLMIANFIESLNWTRRIAFLARPLIRFGHLSDTTGASFSLAVFSGVSANTLLAEAYDQEKIGKAELVLANLFNSLPTFFVHLPTMFFITVPLIKGAAFVYVGLTLMAALLRTFSIVIVSRFLLSKPDTHEGPAPAGAGTAVDWRQAMRKSWLRFKKRIRKILFVTVPIYIIVYIMNRIGFFTELEQASAAYLSFIPGLTPHAMGIITLQMASELTAGVAAAGALLQDGKMEYREIILALLVGNILSSPLRAVRHQFPYYAGIFKPKVATELIVCNQAFRVFSLVLVAAAYFIYAF
ncbi:hypothetical protein JWG42_00635 [Desulfoprunum benzoelyticum]|uniref:Nucleoside recognition protein n=1 Tax=Desulfoprunum benzoelyticum TaxID=1506996 RepID=A0A840UZC7_9BACT|nr:hypothetical protein [Desulfoprunum benzoelyticum]MBB5346341.1 hypothetical protein [Desulfoprunum benzoelyticum]MBM9528660.1 hypothetical protein [Desulfoprunum benzoelyticum]